MISRKQYHHVIRLLVALIVVFILLLLWNTPMLRYHLPWHYYQWTFSRGILVPACSGTFNDSAVTTSSNQEAGLIVHYVRLYPVPEPNNNDHSLDVLDCLSVYSVLLNLKPQSIYLHTNVPSFWPFGTCESHLAVTIDWSLVKVFCAPFQYTSGIKRISHIAHEADIRKFRAVEEYGGLVLDFDVYVINGVLLRQLMEKHPCIVCHEIDRLNAGFFGCRTRQAEYPKLVLASYHAKYNPYCWLCSSGYEPFAIWKKNQDIASVIAGVCDHESGVVETEKWATLPAFHSYWHRSSFTVQDVRQLRSTWAMFSAGF